jgi:hypothetical protein
MTLLSAMIPSRQEARNRHFREMGSEIGRKMLREQMAAGIADTTKKDVMSVLSKENSLQHRLGLITLLYSPSKYERKP